MLYTSLHYVVALNSNRLALTEYRRFSGLSIEIQIRTVIQHAWAEIEHDLGYKRESAIPKTIKRKFFQLAAMLEVADEGFSSIKKTLAQYERDVGEAIVKAPETVEIDATSIREYMNNSLMFQNCELKIHEQTGLSIEEGPFEMSDRDAAILRWVGIHNINELDKFLATNSDIITDLAIARLKVTEDANPLTKGITLLYVCYVILAKKGIKEFMKFFEENSFGPDEKSLQEAAMENIAFVSNYRKETS